MTVLETNPVGRAPISTEHLDDLCGAILLPHDPAVNKKPVTNTRLHAGTFLSIYPLLPYPASRRV